MKEVKKEKHIWEYMRELDIGYLSVSRVDEVLGSALDDGIEELVLSEQDYKTIRRYLLGTGLASWDWDRKTIYGITLCIR